MRFIDKQRQIFLKTDSINFSFDKEPENRKRTFLTRHCTVGFLLSVIQNNSVSKNSVQQNCFRNVYKDFLIAFEKVGFFGFSDFFQMVFGFFLNRLIL